MKTLSLKKFEKAGCTVEEAARRIKLVALDVDGVLTNGLIGYTGTPDEIKFFHVRDGSGITMLRRTGLVVGVISGRRSKANQFRAAGFVKSRIASPGCHASVWKTEPSGFLMK